jgi:hypothetical protein
MWYMQQAHDSRRSGEENPRTSQSWLVPTESKPAQPIAPPVEVARSVWTRPAGEAKAFSTQSIAVDLDALVDEGRKGVLERVSQPVGAVRRHPFAVVTGALVMFLGLSIWAFSPAPGNRQITRLESILVQLGLAEAPSPAPPTLGRPDARVWVDVHTALYYCEGSELYGKTPEGRFTTQQEAQQDQFQPASQLFCK